jgi:hypothetical protein
MMINDIFLSFHTDDPSQIQLACDFWELREDGGWLYPVKDLMATTGLRRVDLLETVQSAATAVCLGNPL